MKPDTLHLLVHALGEGYDRRAWHGPSLCGAIRGVSLPEAVWRPPPERRNT